MADVDKQAKTWLGLSTYLHINPYRSISTTIAFALHGLRTPNSSKNTIYTTWYDEIPNDGMMA